MWTVGVVTSAPDAHFVIAKHSFGFTAVELPADHGICVGDQLRADWKWHGNGDLTKSGTEHSVYFHLRHKRSNEAASQVERLTSGE
jgi:hypothetical protein